MQRMTHYLRLKTKDPPMDPRITDWIIGFPQNESSQINTSNSFINPQNKKQVDKMHCPTVYVSLVSVVVVAVVPPHQPTHKPSNQVFNQPNIEWTKQSYIQPVILH